jgi:hypothetical protein
MKDDTEPSQFEVTFLVEVPPLGLATYFISKSASSVKVASYTIYKPTIQGLAPDPNVKKLGSESISIKNPFYKVSVSREGYVNQVDDLLQAQSQKLDIKVRYQNLHF